MTRRGHLLVQAREAAKLSADQLALWAGVDSAELRAAEEGTGPASALLLDRCARVFGLRLVDLVSGEAGRAPMTLWLRSSVEDGLDLRSVLTTEVHEALGEFQRCVRDIHELERLLGVTPPSLPAITCGSCPQDVHLGDHRARCVRQHFGLEDEPVASVSSLAERMGIAVVWVTDDDVDRMVDGAGVRAPRPAILVNVLQPGKYPWRARITLAHELGHLLFDMSSPGRQVLVSARSTRPPERIVDLEQTALAFAACLLAPTGGVRETVNGIDPTSERAVCAIGSRFGVGRTVAINRLQHVFELSAEQREQMERRTPEPYQGDFEADQPPEPTGFRGEPLLGLVRKALAVARISATRSRAILGIPVTSPLPFPELPEAARESAITPENRAIRVANSWLQVNCPGEGLVPGMPEREGPAWRVPLTDGGVGALDRRPRGFLLIGPAGEVTERLHTAEAVGPTR